MESPPTEKVSKEESADILHPLPPAKQPGKAYEIDDDAPNEDVEMYWGHKRDNATTDTTTAKPKKRWRCDAGCDRVFDSYDECLEHERACQGGNADGATRNNLADSIDEGGSMKRSAKKSFAQRINELRAYKEKNGHVNVKHSDDKSLYGFCIGIRNARNNLDALGFDWAIKEQAVKKSFEQRMDDLRAYKERHGHVNVKGSEDKSLYGFCSNMRQARNNPRKSKNMLIDDERIASLDALGFTWSAGRGEKAAKKSFAQRLEDLQAYKAKNGHVNVKESEDKSLSSFCRKMRHARRHPEKSDRTLTKEKIASLDALGFEWNLVSKSAPSLSLMVNQDTAATV